ncbi:MAG: ATP-binding cassette domain-containing protein [Chloroflexi bacterium]|nr:ATP-binding cassette domain-containing protein [Chloroflexota bacterium]
MTECAIRLLNLTKRFDGEQEPAVSALSLDVPRGRTVALIGPSGCGKTTTLRMINRLVEPTSGRIEIDGEDASARPVAELRRSIGYVIQEVGLFPHQTVSQNIATVPRMLRWDRGRIDERVAELADLLGLETEQLGRYPDELSGGQQQRVGVARALAADPPVLLMDEPFGAVDPIVRTRLQDELLALQERLRKTIVIVTHDIDEAVKVADNVALLNIGGKLEQYAAPDDLLHSPANAFVEQFLGEDREMKRLALKRVGDLPFERGPVLDLGAAPAEARALLGDARSEWLGLTQDERFAGWVPRERVDTAATLDALPRELPAAQVHPGSTLREAMEVIMNSRTSVAVIDDGGRFGGVVTLEQIRSELARRAS